MKNIIFILLLLPVVCFSQTIGRLKYQTIQQTYRGDTIETIIGTDTAKFDTNLDFFNFNKRILVNKDTILTADEVRAIAVGGGSLKNGFLYFDTDSSTFWPHANKAAIWRNEQIYYHASGGLGLDTTLYLETFDSNSGLEINTVAGDGIQINTTSGLGLSINSTNGYGAQISTTNGYNHALFGSTGDSLAISKNGISQYYTGNKIFNTNQNTDFGTLHLNNFDVASSIMIDPASIEFWRKNRYQYITTPPYSWYLISTGDTALMKFQRRTSSYTSAYCGITYNNEFIQFYSNDTVFQTTPTGQIKCSQISAALTDGTPTDAEIDAATGLTPATAGAGYQVTIKDNNGTGLLYKIESDGTDWYYIVMTKAL